MPEIKDRVDELESQVDRLLKEIFKTRAELSKVQAVVQNLEDLRVRAKIVERPKVEEDDVDDDMDDDDMGWGGWLECALPRAVPPVIRQGVRLNQEQRSKDFLAATKFRRQLAARQQQLDGMIQVDLGIAEEISDAGWPKKHPCRGACKCVQRDFCPKIAPKLKTPTSIPEEAQSYIAVALDPLINPKLPKTYEELAELLAVFDNACEALRAILPDGLPAQVRYRE